jgi:hypothetical protein
MAVDWMAAQELVRRYNDDPRSFTDTEAEMIATISNQFGMDFQRESRPLAKGAFDFADIASFGLLPNKWRPTARGESVYGETGVDKLAGGIGTVGGLFGAAGVGRGVFRGGQAAWNRIRGGGAAGGGGGAAVEGEIVRKSAEGVSQTGRGLLPPYRGADLVANQRRLYGGGIVPAPRRLGGSTLSSSTPMDVMGGKSYLDIMSGVQRPLQLQSPYNPIQQGFQNRYITPYS